MKEIKDRIDELRSKAEAKQARYDKENEKLEKSKAQVKKLGKEIADISAEIRKLETQSLMETLQKSGIGVSEIEKAVASGLVKANTLVTDAVSKQNNRDTYITNDKEEESV